MPVYAGLEQWFDIKGWWTNPVVKAYMEEIFQTSYTHGRGRLSSSYKNMISDGDDPRARSPFEWISLQKWRGLCDHYETEKFQKRSKINIENRSHLPYSHTSGSQSFHTRLLQMEKQSIVDNFAKTHMKNSVFVNQRAAAVHAEMVNKMTQAKESDGDEVSEREIIKQTLGKHTGYEKGLGYGFVPSKCSKRSTCDSSQIEALQEKLSSTEEELHDATSRIKSQEGIINNYNERCQRQDEEIACLRESQNELKKVMLTLMQQNNLHQPCF